MRQNKKELFNHLNDYYDYDYYDIYDYEDNDDDWYYYDLTTTDIHHKSNFFHIKDGYDQFILKQLSQIPRDFNLKNFKSIIIDNCFILEVATELEIFNNRFIYKKIIDHDYFSISLFEITMPDIWAERFIGWDTDFRFKSKDWASKFKWQDASVSLDELLDIIKHCFKLSRLRILI